MEFWELRQMRALPLDMKIAKSLRRIREWHDHWRGQIYVSFSGGVDSSTPLHLVRSIYPDIPAVFADTGLEYPEKISAKCCHFIKKKPLLKYERRTGRAMMTGESASDSPRRGTTYLQYGCDAFGMKRPKSTPLAFWTKDDVLRYLRDFRVPYCRVYDEIIEENGRLRTSCERATGCMFCAFGVHREGKNNKFTRMKRSHPELWRYRVYTLGLKDVLEYIGVPYGGESETVEE